LGTIFESGSNSGEGSSISVISMFFTVALNATDPFLNMYQSLCHTPPAWFSPPLAPSNVSGCRPKAVNPLHSAWGMTAGLPTARRSLGERRGGRISSPRAQRSNYKPNKSNLCIAKTQHTFPKIAGGLCASATSAAATRASFSSRCSTAAGSALTAPSCRSPATGAARGVSSEPPVDGPWVARVLSVGRRTRPSRRRFFEDLTLVGSIARAGSVPQLLWSEVGHQRGLPRGVCSKTCCRHATT